MLATQACRPRASQTAPTTTLRLSHVASHQSFSVAKAPANMAVAHAGEKREARFGVRPPSWSVLRRASPHGEDSRFVAALQGLKTKLVPGISQVPPRWPSKSGQPLRCDNRQDMRDRRRHPISFRSEGIQQPVGADRSPRKREARPRPPFSSSV